MGIRAEFLQHQLATGRPVRPATASMVLRAGRWLTGRAPDTWEAADLAELAWYGLVDWCRTNAIVVPGDAARALQQLAEHLDPDGIRGLAGAVNEVVDPVGLADAHRAGRTARHPTRSRESLGLPAHPKRVVS